MTGFQDVEMKSGEAGGPQTEAVKEGTRAFEKQKGARDEKFVIRLVKAGPRPSLEHDYKRDAVVLVKSCKMK